MSETVRVRLMALVDEGRCESVEGRPFLPLVVLDSGMRYGLAVRDDELLWARAQDGPEGQQVLIFASEGAEIRFVELVEQDREQLEERIADAADALGLPGTEVVATLPVVAIVAGLLEGRTALFCRHALRWVRPSELRALRSALVGVAEDRGIPGDIRSLAERLVVPASDG